MAVEDIIAKGVGFAPGSVKFIPTHGFISAAVTTQKLFGRIDVAVERKRKSLRVERQREELQVDRLRLDQ